MSDPFYKSRNSHEPYSRGSGSHADAPAGGGGPGRFKSTSPHGLDAHATAFTIPVARSEADTGVSGRLLALPETPTSLPARQLTPAPLLVGQSSSDNLLEAAKLSLPLLPAEMRDKVAALLSPEAIATLAVIVAAWGGSHYIGIGFAADLVLGGLAVYMLGAEAVTITQDLYSYYSIATAAQSKDDLQRAATHFARAISALGVDILAAIVAKRVFKKAGQKIDEAKTARRSAEKRPETEAPATRRPPPEEKPPLRQAYESDVKGLADKAQRMKEAGESPESIARQLHAERRALGVKYKDMTPPELLEKIYARNEMKYGDKLGPSVDYLRAQGKTWEQITESATRSGGQDINFQLK